MKSRQLSILVLIALLLCTIAPTATAFDAGNVSTNNQVISMNVGGAYINPTGSLWMWGECSAGEFGIGLKDVTIDKPVEVMKDVASVSRGSTCTAILKTDGSLWTCGWNFLGQLGNGGVGNVIDDTHGTNDGTGKIVPTTKEDDGRLINVYQTVPTKIMDDVAAVSVGGTHMAAVKKDGSLWVWGDNSKGQLGVTKVNMAAKNGHPFQSIPLKVMDGVKAVSCGEYHSAAIKTDGSLWTWGETLRGQLGCGPIDYSRPNYAVKTPVKVADNVVAVSCGYSSTAIIKENGTLWTCGSGQTIGNGISPTDEKYGDHFSFIKIMDNVASVSCGSSHMAAIKTDGSLWTWGDGGRGELGNGKNKTLEDVEQGKSCIEPSPVKIMNNVVAVSCAGDCTMAAQSDGTLWTWGFNHYGYLGYYGGNSSAYLFGVSSLATVQNTPKRVEGATVKLLQKDIDTSPNPSKPYTFTDVKPSDYFADAVAWAVEKDITSGTSATTFSPNTPCTRAQAVTFLWRVAGKPEPKGDATFSDVKSGSYYDKAVRWAVEKGITSGTGNGKFSPDEVCSRAQIVTLLYRFEGSPSASGDSFSDVPASAYYANAVAWGVSKGITSGTGNGKFSPDTNCTRAQIVTLLYRDMEAGEVQPPTAPSSDVTTGGSLDNNPIGLKLVADAEGGVKAIWDGSKSTLPSLIFQNCQLFFIDEAGHKFEASRNYESQGESKSLFYGLPYLDAGSSAQKYSLAMYYQNNEIARLTHCIEVTVSGSPKEYRFAYSLTNYINPAINFQFSCGTSKGKAYKGNWRINSTNEAVAIGDGQELSWSYLYMGDESDYAGDAYDLREITWSFDGETLRLTMTPPSVKPY